MAKYGKDNPYHKRLKPVHNTIVISHPLYATWTNIKDRCYNVDSPSYANYGGRGITMCHEWYVSFETFALDMGLKPSASHTIDRRDNDGEYSAKNCIWATRVEQAQNRRKFKNNSVGETGVKLMHNNRYAACFDYDGTRYNLGRFATVADAKAYREKFKSLFFTDIGAALKMTERRARTGSITGMRGITKNDSGFIVRKTVAGVRKYMGTTKTLTEAISLWNASN